MALIRWEPARDLNSLFSSIFDTPTGSVSAGRRWLPAMDLVETDDHFVLRADLPGLSEDDVDVTLENDVLTVSGQRKAETETREKGYYRVERASGSFRRSLSLPEGVDPDAIEANFDKGVLEVRIPKPEQRKPRKVAITVGGGEPKTIEGSESA
jgi:HSP20 family protein